MNVLSDELILRYNKELQALEVLHPNEREFANPLIQLRKEHLDKLSFEAASQFIGERLILLIPSLREFLFQERDSE